MAARDVLIGSALQYHCAGIEKTDVPAMFRTRYPDVHGIGLMGWQQVALGAVGFRQGERPASYLFLLPLSQPALISSTMLNPYASFLNGGNPLEVIAATPARLAALAAAPSRAPKPGKWDIREILCHLADCEITFGFRLRQAVAEPHHTIQPFDQDQWAECYSAYDLAGALDLFGALRRWNVKFIAAQPADVFERQLTHPERGIMTFRTLVETMAGHDLNHVRQIEALA